MKEIPEGPPGEVIDAVLRASRRERKLGMRSVRARTWTLAGAVISFGLSLGVAVFRWLPAEVVFLAVGAVLVAAFITFGVTLAAPARTSGPGDSAERSKPPITIQSLGGLVAVVAICWAWLPTPVAVVVSAGFVTGFILWHLTTMTFLDAFVVFLIVLMMGKLLVPVATPRGRLVLKSVRPIPSSPPAAVPTPGAAGRTAGNSPENRGMVSPPDTITILGDQSSEAAP